MTAVSRSWGRKAAATAAVFALGAFGMVAGASAANAAEIDGDALGSITVHKYANPATGSMNPDGTGTLPTTGAIADVVFEYCLISGIDLTDGTNTDWDALNAITDAQKLAAAAQGVSTLGSYALTGCTEMPATDATGTSTTGDIPVGAYFVREVDAPSNVVEPAAPFIVTVPTPVATGSGWVYDVNVYPKNTVATGPVKNIVDQEQNGAALGSVIDYQVTQLIPELAAGQSYDKLVFSDTLDTKLTPVTDLSTVTVTDATADVSFVNGVDFIPVWNGQKLTVTFTASGLAKLEAGNYVVVGFQATANAIGAIDNQAFVNLNDWTLTPGQTNGPDGSPTNVVQTRWGSLVLEKIDARMPDEDLSGAEFTVWMGTTDVDGECVADNGTTGFTQVTEQNSTDPYVVVSDIDGKIVIPGLWVGDTELIVNEDGSVENVTVDGHDFDQRCYLLQELKAPAGYVLPTGNAALTPVMVETGVNGTVSSPYAQIPNEKQTVPELPLTGANGQLALTVGGIALLGAAIGGVLMTRRRSAKTDA